MKRIVILALVIAIHVGLPGAAPHSLISASAVSPPSGHEELVERFLQSNQPPLTSYRALRRLEASTRGGRMAASVEAWTSLDASGTFEFEVVRTDGSGLIRDRVLLKALETERQSHNNHEAVNTELSPTNYNFEVREAVGSVVAIGLVPRRPSPTLLIGAVTVQRGDGDMLQIDGRLSKNPSWWTRRVDIVRRYARIQGVRVPVEMSSRADVRIVGDSSFEMTYEYTSINGRPVRQEIATTSANGSQHARNR